MKKEIPYEQNSTFHADPKILRWKDTEMVCGYFILLVILERLVYMRYNAQEVSESRSLFALCLDETA